jgi:protein-tyrosine phosphatase
MTDIHSHVIWDVDDGPATLEESIVMLRAAAEDGTADLVATPHANPRYPFQHEIAWQRIRELTEATGGRPRIHLGCEFHLTFDNVDHLMDNLGLYTINGKQYLLVECPDSHIGRHTESILRRIVEAGVVPIVAHPERNPVLRQKLSRVEGWVESGCLLQLTALSVTGGFGASAREAALRLLDRGLAHFVASDAHDPVRRHPRLGEARQLVLSRYGEDAAEILFSENPRAVVEGTPLSGGKQLAWQRPVRWYQFWKAPC